MQEKTTVKLHSKHPDWSHDGPPKGFGIDGKKLTPTPAALPGCETADADRASALGLAQAEEMTAELRKPLGDVSGKAGRMEREAPLFFGQGDNPTLF